MRATPTFPLQPPERRSGLRLLSLFLSVAAACGPVDEAVDDVDDTVDLDVVDLEAATDEAQALTTNVGLTATTDTIVRSQLPHAAAGTATVLQIRGGTTGVSRSLLTFDTAAIKAAVGQGELLKARIRLKVASASTLTAPAVVSTHAMLRGFQENGATWSCANDTNTSNSTLDCASADVWTMGGSPLPWASTPTSTTTLAAPLTSTTVFLDVTADVSGIIEGWKPNHGWLVKWSNEATAATVNFGSRTSTLVPVLVIDVAGPCGDGVLDVLNSEQCDDGNTVHNDGCSAWCTIERCGDGFRQTNEACDDGNLTSGDGCTFCTIDRCGDGRVNLFESCDDGNTVNNDGCSSTCRSERCGDGVRQTNEACDDGNQTSGDGCSFCTIDRCGDRVVNNAGIETCDDGNTVNNDGCSATCRSERCGDGVRQTNEACDDGNQTSGDGCSFCTIDRCGDRVVNNNGVETCDDGNTANNDGCSATCRSERCGDGVRQTNEACDDGNQTSGDGCSFCTIDRCGDRVINNNGAETCDDGNTVNNDGCSSTCRVECGGGACAPAGACGDGVRQTHEACDDGNFTSGDGCSGSCALERCGDGIVNNAGREQCDDGNTVAGDGCGATCSFEFCGNGVRTGSEACDDGNFTGGDGCTASCALERCGDGVINNAGREQCDDGNTVAGDGCSATCAFEFCGNGVRTGSEACDDGNFTSGDGCSASCALERCGDGVINNAGREQCDDGNRVEGDGCDKTCAFEFCGNGIVDRVGEQCDDGNFMSGDGCSQACVTERCGDGAINNRGREMCDDGNTLNNDGCSSSCIMEFCGDAVIQSSEQCDDGNFRDGDGCTTQCVRETGPEICGDGVDNDGDGFVDCADMVDCWHAFTCQ
jgi:cysteine-rich repeat protein